MADGPTAVGLLGGRARRAVTSVCGWKCGAKAGGRTSAGKWARMATLIEADPADREPQRLAIIPGGHFAPNLNQFPMAAAAATTGFREHLGGNHEIN
jgi:hypothetical protein